MYDFYEISIFRINKLDFHNLPEPKYFSGVRVIGMENVDEEERDVAEFQIRAKFVRAGWKQEIIFK